MKSESNAMRSEIQLVEKNVASLLEQFEWMRARWKEQQRERNNKEKWGEQSPGGGDSEAMPEAGGR